MRLHENTRIVTCGGTGFVGRQALRMHEQVRALCGRKRPRALLIPTASYDDPERVKGFERVYGRKLGCRTQSLLLLGNRPDKRTLRDAIEAADIIFVSGGNTLKMMRRWRYLGVDRLLMRAHKRGVVLAGSSAGALCWYAWGHSDSFAYYHPDNWKHCCVHGLGVLPATGCPHILAENRLADFQRMMRVRPGVGLAMDNDAALFFVGNGYRAVSTRRGAKVFKVHKPSRGQQVTVEVPQHTRYRPVMELFGGYGFDD
jgi:dipeptidase E